jgi:hypothetical protein
VRRAILSSVCLLLVGGQATAAPDLLVDLQYETDPGLHGCPDVEAFRSMVAKRLGYDPHLPGQPLVVEVRIRQGERGMEGGIEWSASARRQFGERRFLSRNQDCEELATTMGFVLAVQIQLMAAEPVEDASPAGADQDVARNAPVNDRNAASDGKGDKAEVPAVAAASSTPDERVPDSAGWKAIAGMGPSVGFGLAPGPIAIGSLFFAVQRGAASVELGAEASLPSTSRQDYGGGFQHEVFLGALSVCAEQWALSACALAKLGMLQVHGVGVDAALSPGGLLAQVGPRLGYSLGLGKRLALLGRVEALYLLTPWSVTVNHTSVWTMPRVGVVAGIDLAVRLW